MRIFVVNLERSFERRKTMQAQLSALNLSHEVTRAIDGKLGEHLQFDNYSDDLCKKEWLRPLTVGEVGCFASHYRLWQLCAEMDVPIVVMEDDIILTGDFVEAVSLAKQLLEKMPYVRLAGIGTPRFSTLPESLPVGWRLVRFLNGPRGTQCYAISPGGAKMFLSCAQRWTMPVDNYMDSFWKHGVKCLGLLPFTLEIPRNIPSTISSEGVSPSTLQRHNVWAPKRFAVRKLAELFRDVKNLEYAVKEACERKNAPI